MNVPLTIKHQNRQSLALKLTPQGVQVLIPHTVEKESPQVRDFIARGLSKIETPSPVPPSERVDKAAILALVDEWTERLGVEVARVQLQPMRSKWGSMSTRGTLTLADDLVRLPRELIEYVVCHELLHLVVPNHNGVFHLLLGRYLPDWRVRERALGLQMIQISEEQDVKSSDR